MISNSRLVVPSGSLINGQRRLSYRIASIVLGLVALVVGLIAYQPTPAHSGSHPTNPGPHPSADKGYFWVCDYPDGQHHRCHSARSDPPEDQCTVEGSAISVEDQRLGEAVDIVGTPFRLHYQSDRMPGRAGTSGHALFDTRELGLGGWTLDVHHAYPYYNRRLYLGDGTQRGPDTLGAIFRVTQASSQLAIGEGVIAAKDSSELYVFENQPPSDHHLRTLDALTGAVRYRFSYDANGRLARITDGDGNITTIERDAVGVPTAIVSPFGQRTALAVDAIGYLSKITNPAGELFQAKYSADGLLTRFTDPRGNIRSYTYDGLGRLNQATDPAGGTKTLGRTNQPQGYTVTLATALGRSTTYQVENALFRDILEDLVMPAWCKKVIVVADAAYVY